MTEEEAQLIDDAPKVMIWGNLVAPYTAQFAANDYEEIVETVVAYEWLHGPDRMSGAVRSALAVADDLFAWREQLYNKILVLEEQINILKKKDDEI